MRRSLQPLAGKRAGFAAQFAGVSRRGTIILSDLRGPAGREEYVWIPFRKWPGKMMFPGSEFRFSARVGAYRHEGGDWDFGLVDIEILEEKR